MAIVWDVPPPPDKGLKASIRLLCVKVGQSHLVAVLGPLQGLQTHWIGEKTKACLGADVCPWHQYPQTWKGFIAVIELHDLGRGQLRRAAAPAVLTCSEEVGWIFKNSERGDVFNVSRPGSRKNGPMVAEQRDLAIPGQLPASFNVRPYVGRAMGISLA
jgi:hypothetical protein